MPPRTFTPALRMRFLYPPATRPISTTPHLLADGKPRSKKPLTWGKGTTTKTPKRHTILSTTSFKSRQPHQRPAREPPKPGPAPPVIPKIMPKGPSLDLIHYIPPSNPMRSSLGPGMYYNAKATVRRCSSTPLDKDLETEYMYTLMLRSTLGTPISATRIVPLKYAIMRCMKTTGAHQKATTTRLRKGFLGEAMGTRLTKKKAWVCDKARAASFDWELHEHMRHIRGHKFSGKDVDCSTPEGQVLGAQGLEKENLEEERGKRIRGAMETLHGGSAATATTGAVAAAASTTAVTKTADRAIAIRSNSNGGNRDSKRRDGRAIGASDSDSHKKLRRELDRCVREDAGYFEKLRTAKEYVKGEHEEESKDDDEEDGELNLGNGFASCSDCHTAEEGPDNEVPVNTIAV